MGRRRARVESGAGLAVTLVCIGFPERPSAGLLGSEIKGEELKDKHDYTTMLHDPEEEEGKDKVQ